MIRRLTLVVALAVSVAACGGPSTPTTEAPTEPTSTTVPATTTTTVPTTTTTPDDGFPVTIDAANGPVTIERRPERIVSLSPTATEMLFAIGAGTQVAAADSFSNYPEEAPTTDLSGFEPNLEAISAYEPDLVVLSYDPGDVIAGLEAIGIPAILQPAATTLDDTFAQIEQLGAATGNLADAAALVARMQADIDELVASVPTFDEPPTYYHELDPTYFTATSKTFIGEIYGLVGLANIADEADPDGYGYPQLSAEYILERDPDFVFLADVKCCGQTAETVAARPGWDRLTAVQEGRVVELDDDVASRWGPRIVDLLATVAEAVAQLEPVG
ncbi:MAG TPA: ABC transporter substrate-binding protein [Actinobacteria bacterium]|nr:ABC transporter substrate-binding protein [Actinomycetota bacterium]